MKIFQNVALLFFVFLSVSCAQKLVNSKIDKPNAAKKHLEAAIAYIEEDQPRDAMRHLKKAGEFDKKSSELNHTYALFYRLEGDIDQQDYYYKRALKTSDDLSKVKNNYGTFLCQRGKFEKGLKLLTSATADYEYLGRGGAYLNKGFCEISSNKIDAAEKSFQQALRLNTHSVRALIELSEIYLKKSEFKSANAYYEQYRQRVPQQGARSLWLGIRLARQNKQINTISSYGLLLLKRYPESAEAKSYQASIGLNKK